MIGRLALAAALPTIAGVALAGATPDASVSTHPFLAGGIQVHESDHDHWTSSLREAGLNTVAVTVYVKQGAWNRAHLWWEDEEPAVVDEIRTAKRRGLAVVLVLRVALDHAIPENRFFWHGMVMPSSPDEIRSWFEQYGRFVAKWARVANEEGVDVLGVGSEMKALSATRPLTRWGNLKSYQGYVWYQRLQRKRALRFADRIEARNLWVPGRTGSETLGPFLDERLERHVGWAREAHLRPGRRTLARVNERRRLVERCWIELIEETRRSYDGLLTYAANFDNYDNVGFWEHLDLIGINSYFSLRGNLTEAADPARQPEHFARRWEEILGRIRAFKREVGVESMPFLFTELGYTFRRHSTVEPWAHGGFSIVGWKGKKQELVVWSDQPIDYGERHRAIEALRSVHGRGGDDFVGLLYWKLSTDPEHEEIEPFVVHVGRDSRDGLQGVLARFARVSP